MEDLDINLDDEITKKKQERPASAVSISEATISEHELAIAVASAPNVELAIKFFMSFKTGKQSNMFYGRSAPIFTEETALSTCNFERVLALTKCDMKSLNDKVKAARLTYVPVTPFNYFTIMADNSSVRILGCDEKSGVINYNFNGALCSFNITTEKQFYSEVLPRVKSLQATMKGFRFIGFDWDDEIIILARFMTHYCGLVPAGTTFNYDTPGRINPYLRPEERVTYDVIAEKIKPHLPRLKTIGVPMLYEGTDPSAVLYATLHDLKSMSLPTDTNSPWKLFGTIARLLAQAKDRLVKIDPESGVLNTTITTTVAVPETVTGLIKEYREGRDATHLQMNTVMREQSDYEMDNPRHTNMFNARANAFDAPPLPINRATHFYMASLVFEWISKSRHTFSNIYIEGSGSDILADMIARVPTLEKMKRVIVGSGRAVASKGTTVLFREKSGIIPDFMTHVTDDLFFLIRERFAAKDEQGRDEAWRRLLAPMKDFKTVAGLVEANYSTGETFRRIYNVIKEFGFNIDLAMHPEAKNMTFYYVISRGTSIGVSAATVLEKRFEIALAVQHNIRASMLCGDFGFLPKASIPMSPTAVLAYTVALQFTDEFKSLSTKGNIGVSSEGKMAEELREDDMRQLSIREREEAEARHLASTLPVPVQEGKEEMEVEEEVVSPTRGRSSGSPTRKKPRSAGPRKGK